MRPTIHLCSFWDRRTPSQASGPPYPVVTLSFLGLSLLANCGQLPSSFFPGLSGRLSIPASPTIHTWNPPHLGPPSSAQ